MAAADLSRRDRSIVTVAALITRNQTIELPRHISLALDNGVEPREISELITHLAFYAGWANAISAVAMAKDGLRRTRNRIRSAAAGFRRTPSTDEAAEEQRAARVEQDAGPVAPGVVHYTAEVLFRDLWLRPDLAPRDRSLGGDRQRLDRRRPG